MKKIKKELLLDIFVIMTIILFCVGTILNVPIKFNDESNIFCQILKMDKGLFVYRDFNLLDTPLFYYIEWIFIKIFGPNIVSFRVCNILISILFFTSIYILMKKIKINKKYIVLSLFSILIFLQGTLTAGNGYNTLTFCLFILSIIYSISHKNHNAQYYILQGIVLFVIFFTKQTMGVYQFIAFCICEFIIDKSKLKNLIYFIIPSIILIGIYIIYLLLNNSLYQFIDYTVLGIIDFRQNAVIETLIILLSLINIIPVSIAWKRKTIDNIQKKLFIYSLVMLLFAYPIVCDYHSKYAMIFSIISFTYYIDNKITFKTYYVEYIIILAFILYTLVASILNIANWTNNRITDNKPYNGAIKDDLIDSIAKKMSTYIEESNKEVVMITPRSSVINIMTGRDYGILDYPIRGNVGLNGEEKILNEIKKLENKKIVIEKDKLYQEYEQVSIYVKNNYRKTNSLFNLWDVYEK